MCIASHSRPPRNRHGKVSNKKAWLTDGAQVQPRGDGAPEQVVTELGGPSLVSTLHPGLPHERVQVGIDGHFHSTAGAEGLQTGPHRPLTLQLYGIRCVHTRIATYCLGARGRNARSAHRPLLSCSFPKENRDSQSYMTNAALPRAWPS